MINPFMISRRDFLKKSGVVGAAAMGGLSMLRNIRAEENSQTAADKKLTFAFLTDIHQNFTYSNDRYNGFLQALKRVKETDAEFIILGGDTVDVSAIYDGKNWKQLSKPQTEMMYQKYKKTMDEAGLPYYPAIGNHDRYFNKDEECIKGDELFKKYFGHSYQTFEKKGVHFFIINSVENENDEYVIGKEQLEWLKKELANIPPNSPIVTAMHVPVFTMFRPVAQGKKELDISRLSISNFKEIHDLFCNHNVQLTLQGHIHWYEEIFAQNMRYVTVGAVGGAWWGGPYYGTEEGFLLVHVDNQNKFTWEYVDYGWTAK